MTPERMVERTLISARWLLAPLYSGLALLLVMFIIHFYAELIHLARDALSVSEVDLVVSTLTLIDLTLIGGLVVMVMLSGYENFVSRLDVEDSERPIAW